MYKILMVISALALILLISVTAILVKLNWSEKLYNPLLSLGLAGTVTTFITVLLMLKGEHLERSFTTLVVIDSTTHLPPFIIPDSTNVLSTRLYDYNNLSVHKANVNGIEQIYFNIPTNTKEETVFYEELLQYRIFKSIILLQKESHAITQGVQGVKSSIHKPFKLTEFEKKPFRHYLSEVSKNRFSNNFHDQQELTHDFPFSKLPKDTEIEFKRIPSSEKTGVEKHLIIVRKPLYFTMQITIAVSLGVNNSIPPNLNINSDIAKRCNTSMFIITMDANFDKITAGNWKTEELKKWIKWLFDGIEKRYSDDNILGNS